MWIDSPLSAKEGLVPRDAGAAASRPTLDELAAQFEDNRDMHGSTLGLGRAEQARFSEMARAVFASVGHAALAESSAQMVADDRLSQETRQAWLASLGDLTASPVVPIPSLLAGAPQRFLLYASTPDLDFVVEGGGRLVDAHARSVEFFGEHWVYEHNLLVDLDAPRPGEDTPAVRFVDRRGRVLVDASPSAGGRAPGPSAPPNPPLGLRKLQRLLAPDWWHNRAAQLAGVLARRGVGARSFARAWALADRRHQAGDNAEALFRHLHEHRRDVNAWFAVGRHVPTYRELRRRGAQVVPYGSIRHYLLLAHAEVFASSQSDPASRNPFGAFLPERWRFVYLKHGVIHTDHHRRFNPMRIDLLLTATPDEHAALTAEPGPYRLTASEVALTGMPRHDLLQARNEQRQARGARPDVLLIAPTWRISLAQPNLDHRWSLRDGAAQSDYVRAWSAVLNDERLRDACADHGLRPVMLMHPRFQHHPGLLPTPPWMEVAEYDGAIADRFARTRLTLTDYSSIAFETAYVGAPTVYFQFDRDEFFSGGHSSQQGDYRYEAQGFGPVAEEPEAALAALRSMLDQTNPLADEYARRIAGLYAFRDTANSARAVAAIEKLRSGSALS